MASMTAQHTTGPACTPDPAYTSPPQYRPFSRSSSYYATDGLKEWKKQRPSPATNDKHPENHSQPISTQMPQEAPPTKDTATNHRTPTIGFPLWQAEKMISTRPSHATKSVKSPLESSSRSQTPAYIPFEDPMRNDEFYRRYLQLSQNVAQKYPNPGPYTAREGSVGGSWRHIKEVQGHSTRVLYVDGIVRVYDQERPSAPHFLPPMKRTPPFAPIRSYSNGPGDNYNRY